MKTENNTISNETHTAPPGNPSDVMLTKKELAQRLKVTLRTIENWQRRGVLPFVKMGKIVLFHWPDVVEHLKANFRVCRRTIIS
jgi:excisionase family DNA binding protein